jgi:hypothetical protein
MARPSTLRRQLHRASRERQRRILDFRVERVLTLLKDDNLATRAALDLDSKDGILLECNFVNDVWEDPRVAARIRQLQERGVAVEPVTYEFQVAGGRSRAPRSECGSDAPSRPSPRPADDDCVDQGADASYISLAQMSSFAATLAAYPARHQTTRFLAPPPARQARLPAPARPTAAQEFPRSHGPLRLGNDHWLTLD